MVHTFQKKQHLTDKEVLLENSSLIQTVSDSIIISAVAEASTPETENITLERSLRTNNASHQDTHLRNIRNMDFSVIAPPPVDLDSLPELKVDNDSDDDQGQFQIITEEYQEEVSTPNSHARHADSIMLHRDKSTDSGSDRSSFFEALANDPSINSWLDDEWKRLDSKEKEKQAEMIAAQVRVFL